MQAECIEWREKRTDRHKAVLYPTSEGRGKKRGKRVTVKWPLVLQHVSCHLQPEVKANSQGQGRQGLPFPVALEMNKLSFGFVSFFLHFFPSLSQVTAMNCSCLFSEVSSTCHLCIGVEFTCVPLVWTLGDMLAFTDLCEL